MKQTESVWPLMVKLKAVEKQVGQWSAIDWQIDYLGPASQPAPEGSKMILLELHKDERASYRLNLDMDNPALYIVCDDLGNDQWEPLSASADQNVAAGCLESDMPLLNVPMPAAIAVWMEAFITRHGEVEIRAHRRKHVNRRKEFAGEQDRKRGSKA
ncbi:DUF3305 domain-containing protein [Paraferrimonas sedimenticola]|uniref:DUF3305 domain-containing protein n=1 Tax=Paraferrimonas sedimenticola TaxID=375674 RepID=A0AA37RYC6_9GAMM|nr:DUF3305 domain-containing protein [Paraferrimonas sedimenticola]GLP97548.1 hypothetical protein GCM10007895_28550 [Paraferrimonas sedimenticola]